MAALFPDPYFHIGGDEVSARAWNQSKDIQAFAQAHSLKDARPCSLFQPAPVQDRAEVRQDHGRMGRDPGPGPAPDAVIQSWRGQKSLAEAASKGYRGILSCGLLSGSCAPGRLPLADGPSGRPAARPHARTGRAHPRRRGLHVGRTGGPETVDSRVWPRTAAIAERFWSPQAT